MKLEGKKCIVVGAGKSGVAAARFMARRGAEVVLNDISGLDAHAALEDEGIVLVGGGHPAELFRGCDLVVLSPGVPASSAPVSAAISEAEKGGAEVVSEVELASRFTDTPIIAVAGTNGKSTTTTLIGHILESAGKRVFTGGNLGTPLCQYLIDGDDADLIVLEVSSFQLERIASFRPFISIMLNITPDHLDRYNSMEEYVAAKKRLFVNQGSGEYAVLNLEDRITASLAAEIHATVVPFGLKKEHPGGVRIMGDCLVSDIKGHPAVIERETLKLAGSHNTENLMAAVAAALLSGLSEGAIKDGVKNFEGLSHRMEFVAEMNNVRFYDDSKATNVGALLKSLEGVDGKVVLIAGGRDKGGSYEQLLEIVREKVRSLVLIGEAAGKMEAVFGPVTDVCIAATMEEAVDKAWQLAKDGDVVLLSPACSSFDMFAGYAERGDIFKRAVYCIESPMKGCRKEARVAG